MHSRRSEFLFHWTGKDIEANREAQAPPPSEQYVGRLQSLMREGLRLNVCHEIVRQGSSYHGLSPRLACFTETRLSAAEEHAHRYGLLGLGFHRQFVLKYAGGPVHYVRGHEHDPIFESVRSLTHWLSSRMNVATDESEKAELLSKFQCAYHILAFTKPMTDARSQAEDFSLLHEHEWRIVEVDAIRSSLRETAVPRPGSDDVKLKAVPIEPSDLRLLVFPDDETLRLALADEQICEFMRKAPRPVGCLTLDEAAQL